LEAATIFLSGGNLFQASPVSLFVFLLNGRFEEWLHKLFVEALVVSLYFDVSPVNLYVNPYLESGLRRILVI
jgi:ascorbate-specific PTS system EIIC-type component UlaA